MKITEEAEKDVDNQEDFDRKKLSKEIKYRLTGDRDQQNISYINKPEFGIEFHRLKIKGKGLDHRIYFDYRNSEIIVFAVRHRNQAYKDKDLQEVEQRLKGLE